MIEPVIKIFNCPSDSCLEALRLRYTILREPLGLNFTEEELGKDAADTHLGLWINDKIIACLTLTFSTNRRIKMRQVAVDEKFQGRGYGQLLVNEAEKFAGQNGFEIMFCNARKTAVPFYEKMNYQIVSDEFTEVNIPHYTMEKQIKIEG